MSGESKEGGPAFPCNVMAVNPVTGEQVVRWQEQGLTMRDWFAGQALVAIGTADVRSEEPSVPETWARNAYALADAMLTERAKPGEQRDKPAEGEKQ